MSNNTVQPAIVVFDKDRTEVLGIAPEGTTDITYLSTISEAQANAGATQGLAVTAGGEMVGRDGVAMGTPVTAVLDPVTGGIKVLAGTASYSLLSSIAQRIEAAQRGNAADRPPLVALADWTTGQTVRAGYAVKTSGRVYMYTTSGVTGASAPTYTGIAAVADGTATCIYMGAPRTPVAAVDVPTISVGARSASYGKRANPITDPDKFIFSGGIPTTSGNGVILPAFTSKTAGAIITTTPGKHNNNPCIEFCTDAPIFYINDAGFTISQSCRFVIEIDGYRYQDSAFMNAAGGTSIKFDFSAYPSKERTIRLYWTPGVATYIFEGVWTDGAYDVWAPVQDELTCVVIGTSLTQGSSYSSFIGGLGWPDEFSSLAGLKVLTNIAEGSSGLLTGTGTRYSWLERIQDIFDLAPDVLFVEGPHNDSSKTDAEQLAAYLSFLQQIRTALPNCLIVCFGTNPELLSAQTAMRQTEINMAATVAAMNDSMIWYIPVIFDPAGSWNQGYKHSGNITAMTVGANAQFTLSVTPTCVVGDSVVPFSMTGSVEANGLVGRVTAVAGSVVTTDINTTGATAFTGPSGFLQVNDLYTSQDSVHHHQRRIRTLAQRYLRGFKNAIYTRIGR